MLLLCVAMALCQLQAVDAQECPQFTTLETIVETAPGCKHELNIPFSMKSNMVVSMDIAILDVRPPGATLEVKTQFALIEDSAAIKDLPFTAILRWTPQLDQAGSPREFSLLLSSTQPECRSASHKVIFRVHKCEYCINEKESMHSIAARFSTHWTQLWSSNHQLETPDQLAKGQKIKLGNLYTTVKGDTWKLIAVRFGTTVACLIELNPDLSGLTSTAMVAIVEADTNVCVMPETCPQRRTPFEGVTW